MSRFSHKNILLYGSRSDSSASVGSVFSEITQLRVVQSVRPLVDEYVALILASSQSGWLDSIHADGRACCQEFRKQNESLMDVSDCVSFPILLDDTAMSDLLPDVLVVTAGDYCFTQAWSEYARGKLAGKLYDFFDFEYAGRLRRALSQAVGEAKVNAVFTGLWKVFFKLSFRDAFQLGYLSVFTKSLTACEREGGEFVWQIWLDSFHPAQGG